MECFSYNFNYPRSLKHILTFSLRVTEVSQLALLPVNPVPHLQPPYVPGPVQALLKPSSHVHYHLTRTHLPNLPAVSVSVVSSAPRPAQPLPASSSSPNLEKVRHKSVHLIFSVDFNPCYFPLTENTAYFKLGD